MTDGPQPEIQLRIGLSPGRTPRLAALIAACARRQGARTTAPSGRGGEVTSGSSMYDRTNDGPRWHGASRHAGKGARTRASSTSTDRVTSAGRIDARLAGAYWLWPSPRRFCPRAAFARGLHLHSCVCVCVVWVGSGTEWDPNAGSTLLAVCAGFAGSGRRVPPFCGV